MRKAIQRLLPMAVAGLLAGLAWADSASLQIIPSSIDVVPGLQVFISIQISGIRTATAPEVGSFDMFLGFDWNLVSPTGISFTNLLGDPNLGQALTTEAFGSYWAEAVDVSLLSNSQLDAIQPPVFTLATYSFVGVGTGLAWFGYLGGPVDDGNGHLIVGTKQFVPVAEPSSLLLLFSGMALAWRGIVRRAW